LPGLQFVLYGGGRTVCTSKSYIRSAASRRERLPDQLR